MHSRIIQLSLKPIEVDAYIDTETFGYDDTFVGTIADYVAIGDRKEDIEWFTSCLSSYTGVECTKDTILFKEGFRESYFAKKFEQIKEVVGSMTLEAFATNKEFAVTTVKGLIEDKFAFYVYMDGTYMTLDYFLRSRMEYGKPYYFGGTVDYHA